VDDDNTEEDRLPIPTEWTEEHLSRDPTPREMTAALELPEYEELPRSMSPRGLASLLGLSRMAVYDAIRMKRLPARALYLAGARNVRWEIERDDGLAWAYGRHTGPAPKDGKPHLRRGPGLWMGAVKWKEPEERTAEPLPTGKKRGRPRKEHTEGE